MRGRATGGTCPCSGTYEERLVEVRIAREPEPLVLSSLPQQVCTSCGSRVYPAPVLSRIEAAWHATRAIDGGVFRPPADPPR
jgi:hypothetical protein